MRWPLRRNHRAVPPSPRPQPSDDIGLGSRPQEELWAEFKALSPDDQALLADVRVGCGGRNMPLQQLADIIRSISDQRRAEAAAGLPDQPRPADT